MVDADGIDLLADDPALLRGYDKAVVTPNAAEFRRLWSAMKSQSAPHSQDHKSDDVGWSLDLAQLGDLQLSADQPHHCGPEAMERPVWVEDGLVSDLYTARLAKWCTLVASSTLLMCATGFKALS